MRESRMASTRELLLELNRWEAEWVHQTQRSVTGTRLQSNPSVRYAGTWYYTYLRSSVVPRPPQPKTPAYWP